MGSSTYLIGTALILMGVVAMLSVSLNIANASSFVGHQNFWCDSSGRILLDSHLNKFFPNEGGVLATYDSNKEINGYTWVNKTGIYPLTLKSLTFDDIKSQGVAVNNDTYVSHSFGDSTVWSSLYSPSDTDAYSIFISSLMGGLGAIMVTVIAFVVLVSVNVLSTGLNAYGTRTLVVTMFYSLIWALVSGLGFSALVSVPFFGWFIFLLLTFMYFFGVWGQINNGGSF